MGLALRRRKRTNKAVWKGIVAGLAGGLAGSWTMNQFQKAYTKLSQGNGKASHQSNDYRSREEEAAEDATMKAANRISRALLDQDLTRSEKEKLAPAVHYGFGTSMGALYGVLAELRPEVRAGFGTAFATMLFVAGDEIAVPALHLSKSAREVPLSSHAYALASHLVYGLAAEGVRRGVHAVL